MVAKRTNQVPDGRGGRRGMTLVELMIALTIFGIIMGVVFGFLSGARTSYQETRRKARYQQTMRAAISLISREIRSTGCDPTGAGFEPIAQAGANVLQCRMDFNGDGDALDNGPDEDVIYAYNAGAGELSRDVGAGAVVIVRDLTGLNFQYFDAAGNELVAVPLDAVDRSNVAAVSISFQGETDDGQSVTYGTRVALRNQ